jgi:hypothetical protein
MMNKTKQRQLEHGSARVPILVIAFFLLGIVASALWFSRSTPANEGDASAESESVGLLQNTRDVVERLDAPVAIRFYAVLDPASVSETERAFAERVGQLLSAIERESEGRIKVTRYASDADAKAASADGIQPFNLDKGDACFLGITVEQNERKESLPRLSPEWEQAIELDLARAIARVTSVQPAPGPLAYMSGGDTNAIQDLRRAVPNLASISLEQGSQLLREAALSEFKAAAGEMETRLKQAQQRLNVAHRGESDAEQQEAMKELQRVHVEQTEKLKEIAARLQAQLAELERLKKQ